MSILKAIKIIIFQKNRLKRFVFACKNCFDSHSLLGPLGRYPNCDVDILVKNYEEIPDAIKIASVHDNEIIIEEYIKGTEVSCGILKIKEQFLSRSFRNQKCCRKISVVDQFWIL